ncbi:MAG: HAMP domain-containing protein, partial [Pirellulales bacterium]
MTSERPSGVAPAGRTGLGLRGRLLLAFVGISMFTVVAGLTGHYAFNEVTRALDRTGATIPPALAAVELARETTEVLSAGPRMLNARSEAEVGRLSDTASGDLRSVSRLVDVLRATTVSADVLDDLSSNVSKLSSNLSHLKKAATERVQAANRSIELTNDTFAAYGHFGTAWNRNFSDLQGQVLRLRNSLGLASTPEQRRVAIDRFELAVSTLLSLEQIQREASSVFEFVAQGSSIDDSALLESQAGKARRAVRALEGRIDDLDRDLAVGLVEPTQRLSAIINGSDGLFVTRLNEIEAARAGQRLIALNSSLGDRLGVAVLGLVDRARKDVDVARSEARGVQRVGNLIQLSVITLSLISSALIVWLYVGRNIVARLTKLGDVMTALAGGKRDVAVPLAGTDEVGAMGRAVEVFRQNAIELDRLL